MSDKPKFPRAIAAPVAAEMLEWVRPYCLRDYLLVAGSFRRGKAEVGDLEIVYVSERSEITHPGEMFAEPCAVMDVLLDNLAFGKVSRRLSVLGQTTWGAQIKLATHRATGLPVDFFATTKASWWNYLVCRTGPKESNEAICNGARQRGLKWKPYSPGFCRADDPKEEILIPLTSERQVFEFVGLEYKEPKDR